MGSLALMSIMRDQAHGAPDRPFATWGKEAPTYLEAYSLATVLARYFAGVAKLSAGDAVLLSSPNTMGCICAAAAAQACGARTVLAPMGTPPEAVRELLRRERPRVALVADPATCSCVREELPEAPVFSMGASDVDAPSMGYMADQAIGLVDEVYLKVEDLAFDEARDDPMAFAAPDGACATRRASELAAEGRRLAAERGLAAGERVSVAASFCTPEGMARVYAALDAGATIVLGA